MTLASLFKISIEKKKGHNREKRLIKKTNYLVQLQNIKTYYTSVMH